jgi:hypothetical protein
MIRNAPSFSRTAVISVRLQSPWAGPVPARPPSEDTVTEMPKVPVPVSGPILGSDKRVLAIVGPDGPVFCPEDLLHAVDRPTVPAVVNQLGHTLGVALCGRAVHLWSAAFEPQVNDSGLYATQVVVTGAIRSCCHQCLRLVGVELSS